MVDSAVSSYLLSKFGCTFLGFQTASGKALRHLGVHNPDGLSGLSIFDFSLAYLVAKT